MRIDNDVKLDFKDVLIRPKRSALLSRAEVDITREFHFKHSLNVYNGIPIIAANMDTIGTMAMARALEPFKLSTALHKHYKEKQLIDFFKLYPSASIFYTMGITKDDLDKFSSVKKILDAYNLADTCMYVCIDVANGYTENFVSFVEEFRCHNPNITLMAGNVVTGEMTEELILMGADIVKVGIGPGSVCTTRAMTGVGYPQLSAVIECADAAHGLGGLICADGGCVTPGDVAKAFGAGADFVMLGGMLAGHNECAGEMIRKIIDGQPSYFMKFYGMSSATAMEKYAGGVAEYRASEGKEILIPFRGPVADTVQDILGGLRSACTYVGAHRLKELSKRTTFVKIGGN